MSPSNSKDPDFVSEVKIYVGHEFSMFAQFVTGLSPDTSVGCFMA